MHQTQHPHALLWTTPSRLLRYGSGLARAIAEQTKERMILTPRVTRLYVYMRHTVYTYFVSYQATHETAVYHVYCVCLFRGVEGGYRVL